VRNIVRRYALKTGNAQGFGIDEKVTHCCVDRPDNAASISPDGPAETSFGGRQPIGLHISGTAWYRN
jgi:hypothetical protein